MIYPRRCPICGEIVEENLLACETCQKNIKKIEYPTCFKCGKMVEVADIEYCFDCMRIPKSYVKGFPVYAYSGSIKDSLASFKYNNKREYALFYATSIFDSYKEQLLRIGIDGIIPVPVHKSRLRKRGYNQAYLIANELGRLLNIRVYKDVVKRVIKTAPQKELNDKERIKNLKSAFKIALDGVQLKKVLIVDDIYTTGATIEAITHLLLEVGIEEVYYTSVCIGKGQ